MRQHPSQLHLLHPGKPLWQRVPSRGEDGRPLFDFMVLMPRLNRASELQCEKVYTALREVIAVFDQQVVFVDLNLKTSLLWVSIKPQKRLCLAFVEALREQVPEARLIASQAEVLASREARSGRWRRPGWLPKLLR